MCFRRLLAAPIVLASLHATAPSPAKATPLLDADPIKVTREVIVPADVRTVFDFVTSEDVLPKVLTGYGLVPAVVHTSDRTGPWAKVGSRRTVHLGDGNTAREEVRAYQKPSYFAYKVDNPTFVLRHFMTEAIGEWWFSADPSGGTHIRWTYSFKPKSPLAEIPLALFAYTQWSGYMDTCLNNVRRLLTGVPVTSAR